LYIINKDVSSKFDISVYARLVGCLL